MTTKVKTPKAKRATAKKAPVIQASSTLNPADWFVSWLHQDRESDSGIPLASDKSALAYSTVWQCTNILAGDMGMLDVNLWYENDDGSREICVDDPAQALVRGDWNSMMSSGIGRELLGSHALLRGNGRAGIVRDRRGYPQELVPFLPDRSQEAVVNGKLIHLTKLGDSNEYTPFSDDDVVHLKGMGYDGIRGYSVIELARNSFGLSLALEKHANRHFRNGAKPSVILQSPPGPFDENASQAMLNDWEKRHRGLNNTSNVAMLRNGWTATTLDISNEDSQWLDGRRLQKEECGGWFGIPPSRIGVPQNSSYASLEMENMRYVDFCLARWLKKFCDEFHRKLLTEEQKRTGRYSFRFDTSPLLRGDMKTRYSCYAQGIQSTFLSPNDVRRMEGLGDREAGDEYRNPNTTPKADPKVEIATDQTGETVNNRAMIAAQLRKLLEVERKRIVTAATKAGNFLEWATGPDGFYARWSKTLTKLVLDCGGEPWHAQEYVEDSKQHLLTVCGTAKPETLAADVQVVTARWPEQRAELLADAICA